MADPKHFNNQYVGVNGIDYSIRAFSYTVLTLCAGKLTSADGKRIGAQPFHRPSNLYHGLTRETPQFSLCRRLPLNVVFVRRHTNTLPSLSCDGGQPLDKSVTLQPGDHLVVRDGWLVPTFGDRSEVFNVLK